LTNPPSALKYLAFVDASAFSISADLPTTLRETDLVISESEADNTVTITFTGEIGSQATMSAAGGNPFSMLIIAALMFVAAFPGAGRFEKMVGIAMIAAVAFGGVTESQSICPAITVYQVSELNFNTTGVITSGGNETDVTTGVVMTSSTTGEEMNTTGDMSTTGEIASTTGQTEASTTGQVAGSTGSVAQSTTGQVGTTGQTQTQASTTGQTQTQASTAAPGTTAAVQTTAFGTTAVGTTATPVSVSTAVGTTAQGTAAQGTTAQGTTAQGTTAQGTTAQGTTANPTTAAGTSTTGAVSPPATTAQVVTTAQPAGTTGGVLATTTGQAPATTGQPAAGTTGQVLTTAQATTGDATTTQAVTTAHGTTEAVTTKGVACQGLTTGLGADRITFDDLAAEAQGNPVPVNYHCMLWQGANSWTVTHDNNNTATGIAYNTGGSTTDFPSINKPSGSMIVDLLVFRRSSICPVGRTNVYINGTLNNAWVFTQRIQTLTVYANYTMPALPIDTLTIDMTQASCSLLRIDTLAIHDGGTGARRSELGGQGRV